MKILVRNLARTTTEDDIKQLFSDFGVVIECTLVLDQVTGASKGFAFIEMNSDSAETAIKQLNLSMLDNSKIRVKLAEG